MVKTNNIDFLFIYEIKNRELENICLLKYELERRGYSVAIVETWYETQYDIPLYNAKVVIVFSAYRDESVYMAANYVTKLHRLVNMQWEQLFTISDETADENNHYYIKGLAKQAVHISWGQFNYDRLVNMYGIRPKNVALTGHITMDFFKPRFKGYYKNRKQIATEFCFDESRKVYLFVSSFSYVDIPDNELDNDVYTKLGYSPHEKKKIAIKSQREILEWIDEALIANENIVFIYRPHPAEIGNKRLEDLAKKHDNFKVIRDYSIKQWISIADKIYTWYSTSVAEIYAGGKTFDVLRPIELPREMEMRIFEGCEFITDKQTFLDSFGLTRTDLPINLDVLKYYYSFSDKYTYEMICDCLERVIADGSYEIVFDSKYSTRKGRTLLWLKKGMKRFLTKWFTKGFSISTFLTKHNRSIAELKEQLMYERNMIMNNYAQESELMEIEDHIRKVIMSNI